MNHQNSPQPDPKPAAPDVRQSAHWLVCADIMDRAAVGQAEYGVPLVVDNGRDHMMDGYQELLDAVCYRRMEIEQRRQNAAPLSDDALAAECAARGWGVIRPTQGAEAPVLPSGREETAPTPPSTLLHSTWMDGHAMGKLEASGVRQAAVDALQPIGFDFARHLAAQRDWSAETFGPGMRTEGIVVHIRKELEEILAKPDDVEEWIDVLILACDGAWRTGATLADIIDALVRKAVTNQARTWPDWRTLPQGQPSEHTRGNDEIPTDAALRELWERDLWPPMPMEAMATHLSHAGWIVASPDEQFPEPLWQRIGEKEGYAFASSLSPAPMAPILAPEEDEPLTIILECTEGHPLLGGPNGQTVFEHCLACELDRQDAWSAAEIRLRLGELGIPASGLWSDWDVETSRREPRWLTREAS